MFGPPDAPFCVCWPQLATHQARRQRTVLYIAVAPLDSIPSDGVHLAADQTDRIHFMYVPTIELLALRLVALPTSWPHMRPALIVVEALHTFFDDAGKTGANNVATRLHQAALFLATLHDYARTIGPAASSCPAGCVTVCSLAMAHRKFGGGAANAPKMLTEFQSRLYYENNCFTLADDSREGEDLVYKQVVNYLWSK